MNKLMHILCLGCLASMAALIGPAQSAETPGKGQVDVLEYFLQTDDVNNDWTLGGTDVQDGVDPDGTDAKTFILSKFNSSYFYEVFKLQGDELQIRYEVFRKGGKDGTGSWIRRFEEIGGAGKTLGSIWCRRYITPGAEGVFTRFRQDRYIFNEQTHSYELDPAGSVAYFPNYVRFEWAVEKWGRNNKSGFRIGKVLRMVSEWQREGNAIEMYDYAKGKGMVGWRWLERLSTLPRVQDDKTGRLFHCLDGIVEALPGSTDGEPPSVYRHDATSGRRGAKLDAVKLTSVWRKGLGPQWYVVYRDSTKEQPLEKRELRIPQDFSLPEWTSRPGATIRDLPYINTHPPK